MKDENQSRGTSEFLSLDLGSGDPTTVPMETVLVQISAENLLGDYARAFISECHSRHHLRAKSVGLTEKELMRYCEFLLQRRCSQVAGSITDYGRLKSLAIPSFIQFCLENIGIVRRTDQGLIMRPVYDAEVISLEEAFAISNKVAQFEKDLVIVFDAMPRSLDGNVEVMSTALIAGYVKGMYEKVKPVYSYVTAFLGLKLVQESAFAALYRQVYDDYEFIRSALPHRVIK